MSAREGIVYLKHTDSKGHSYIEAHYCWDVERFLQHSDEAARAEGGSISVATAEDYRRQMLADARKS